MVTPWRSAAASTALSVPLSSGLTEAVASSLVRALAAEFRSCALNCVSRPSVKTTIALRRLPSWASISSA
jgi:hypothetical protein